MILPNGLVKWQVFNHTISKFSHSLIEPETQFYPLYPVLTDMKLRSPILSLTILVTSLLNPSLFATLAAQPPVQQIAQAAPSIVDRTWQAEGSKFQVKFFQENNILKGKVVTIAPGSETKDVKNPDSKLRSRNLIGVVMFDGFTYNPSKKIWDGGTAYIPDMGRTMKPKLWLEGDLVKMQISMGFMSKTVTLTAAE